MSNTGLLLLARNKKGHKRESGFLPRTSTTQLERPIDVAMFKFKFFAITLLVAAVHAAAIGRFSHSVVPR